MGQHSRGFVPRTKQAITKLPAKLCPAAPRAVSEDGGKKLAKSSTG